MDDKNLDDISRRVQSFILADLILKVKENEAQSEVLTDLITHPQFSQSLFFKIRGFIERFLNDELANINKISSGVVFMPGLAARKIEGFRKNE